MDKNGKLFREWNRKDKDRRAARSGRLFEIIHVQGASLKHNDKSLISHMIIFKKTCCVVKSEI